MKRLPVNGVLRKKKWWTLPDVPEIEGRVPPEGNTLFLHSKPGNPLEKRSQEKKNIEVPAFSRREGVAGTPNR